jgi:hypothetical protein
MRDQGRGHNTSVWPRKTMWLHCGIPPISVHATLPCQKRGKAGGSPRLDEPPYPLGIAQAANSAKPIDIAEFANLANCKIPPRIVNPNGGCNLTCFFHSLFCSRIGSLPRCRSLDLTAHTKGKIGENGWFCTLRARDLWRSLVILTRSSKRSGLTNPAAPDFLPSAKKNPATSDTSHRRGSPQPDSLGLQHSDTH